VGYSEVGAFAEVLQSTGEYVDGRVVRRTADEALDRDSERCDDGGGGDARLFVAHTPAGATLNDREERVLDRSQVAEPARAKGGYVGQEADQRADALRALLGSDLVVCGVR
jgi:hypothetical protein